MRDRRRRLLSEDAATPTAALATRVTDGGDTQQLYSDAARAARQRGVSALVPLRGSMLVLTVGGLLLAVGGLLGLHIVADRVEPTFGRAAAASLRLDSPASLSAWLGSTLLAAAAAMAIFIFSLRRHRIDDYHGRYRMWLLVAIGCAVGNLFEATSLAAFMHSLCVAGCGATGLRSDIVGPVAMATLVVGLFVRLGIEIRRCGPAVTTLVLASLSLGVAITTNFGWPIAHGAAVFSLWLRGTWLLGYVLLLTTFLLYSRRVQIEVAGEALLPVRVKRKKPAKIAEAAAEETTAERPQRKPALKLRTDLDPVERSTPIAEDDEQAASPKLSLGGKSPSTGQSNSSSDHSSDAKHLSRADRRNQRQEQRRKAS